jgi:hypothetical protein
VLPLQRERRRSSRTQRVLVQVLVQVQELVLVLERRPRQVVQQRRALE